MQKKMVQIGSSENRLSHKREMIVAPELGYKSIQGSSSLWWGVHFGDMGLLLMGILKQNAKLKEGYRRKNRGYTKS